MSRLAAIKRGQVSSSEYFSGRVRPWGIFLVFYKTRHIFLSDSANCTVLRAVVLTQYRRVTDGRTDRRNCYSQYSAPHAAMLALQALYQLQQFRLPVRPSVCPSVRPSHAGIVSKRRHVARCSFHCWIAKCVQYISLSIASYCIVLCCTASVANKLHHSNKRVTNWS